MNFISGAVKRLVISLFFIVITRENLGEYLAWAANFDNDTNSLSSREILAIKNVIPKISSLLETKSSIKILSHFYSDADVFWWLKRWSQTFLLNLCAKLRFMENLSFYTVKKKISFRKKWLIFIFASTAFCENVTEVQESDQSYGKTWMYFPDGEGFPQVISLMNDEMTKMSSAHDTPDSKIKMWLYNK